MQHGHPGGVYHETEMLTSYSVHRERKEREEEEQEGRLIHEEEPDDENMPSPFQPIGDVISEVCVAAGVLYCFKFQYISKSSGMTAFGFYVLFFFRSMIKKRRGRGQESCRRSEPTARRQMVIKRKRSMRRTMMKNQMILDRRQKIPVHVSDRSQIF